MKHFRPLLLSLGLFGAIGTYAQSAAPDGLYYLYDNTSQLFLSRGAAWGTEATADKYGVPFNWNATNGTFMPNDWAGVWLNDGVYTDGRSAVKWTTISKADGYIVTTGGKYLTHKMASLGEYATLTEQESEATVWKFLTKAEHDAIIETYPTANKTSVIAKANLTGVTAENFVSTLNGYTATVTNTIEPTAYQWAKTSNRSDANNTNPREVYQGTGNFTCTITGLKQGIYKVSIPALERATGNAECVKQYNAGFSNTRAYMLANNEQVRIKGWAEERASDNNPNSISQAKALFEQGKYQNEVYTYVDSDGQLSITISTPSFQGAHWFLFGNTTITYYSNNKAEAYTLQLNTCKALLADSKYKNISGNERTALQTATNAAEPTDDAGYTNATRQLAQLCQTFTEALPAYNAYAVAKSQTVPTLPYASATAKNHVATAIAQSVTTATEATQQATTITKAIRAYYESNAKAEGVSGAKMVTIPTASFTGVTVDSKNQKVGTWSYVQSGGNMQVLDNETWTNADESKGGSYFDYWNGAANNQRGTQTVELEPGKYLLTIKHRAQADLVTKLTVNDNTVRLQTVGNSGGVFGRGWNDASIEFTTTGKAQITYGSYPDGGNHSGWCGFGDVRMAKLADLDAVAISENTTYTPTSGIAKVTLERNFNANAWNSLVLPFDMTDAQLRQVFGNNIKVAEYIGATTHGNELTLNFNSTNHGLQANVPTLIYGITNNGPYTIDGVTIIEGTPETAKEGAAFIGSYAAATMLPSGSFFISADNKFYESEGLNTMKGTRGYFRPTVAGAKINGFSVDGKTATRINGLNIGTQQQQGKLYTLSGQLIAPSVTDVKHLPAGVYLINGKKIIIK